MMIEEDEVQNGLVQKMRRTPGREWINTYLDLAKQLLDEAGLNGEDPRLTMSLSPKSRWDFPISINYRYVLALRREKAHGQPRHLVGLIFAPFCRQIPALSRDRYIEHVWQFDNLRGEVTEPPYFLYFSLYEAVNLLATSEQVRQCCFDALWAEVNRAKSSSYRRYHQPKVYQVVVDLKFRAAILDLAFSGELPT